MFLFWDRVLHEDVLVLLIPLAAILVGGVIVVIGQIHRHRERLAMIEQGIDPDAPKGERVVGPVSGATERIG
jgi:hypothetical protein